jgi:hypothetical protein
MYLASDPPGFSCHEQLVGPQQQPKGKTNMSARDLTGCTFAPPAEQTVAAGLQAPAGLAAEIQFREALWREYRFEAINAGFTPAQAAEYASALSPEMGLVAGASELAPGRCGWFYQSRTWVTKRTITSGLIELTRWEKCRAFEQAAAAGSSSLARWFRWWNPGGKS